VSAEFPSFTSFFRAVNRGRSPFPWQCRLAEAAVGSGWPDFVGVPTGLGKTACIDIAVWALASQAVLSPRDRTAPTRIWYVVNRRLLVDAAFDHGLFLAGVLANPDTIRDLHVDAPSADVDVVAGVSTALSRIAALGTEGRPLHVVRLRGGAELGERSPDPSQPALILATVPMFASRFLFRGFGSSTSMRPVDAALAGIDALVLLDEAHLAQPLMHLCETAAKCDIGVPTSLMPAGRARPRLVALTATGDRRGIRLDLDSDDLLEPIVQQRMGATKPTTLVASTRYGIAQDLAKQAGLLVRSRAGSACVVFCNTVQTARTVWHTLNRGLSGGAPLARVVLLTGRMREREAERARGLILDHVDGAPADRDRHRQRDTSLVVVCTQTLEVGADLDFDFLVTETAGVRAIVQRFGRLNRLGRLPHARAVVCHADDAKDFPPYGEEPKHVWAQLHSAVNLDLAPQVITDVLGEPRDVPERTGELLREHLWEFAKTCWREPGEPPVELFFDGFEDTARVSLCWRAQLPNDGGRLIPSVRQDECVELPLRDLRNAVQARGLSAVRRLTADRAQLEEVPLSGLRGGDEVVLPANLGLYDEMGWDPESHGTVLDVALLRSGILWLAHDSIRALIAAGADMSTVTRLTAQLARAPTDDDPEAPQDSDVAATIVAELRSVQPHPWLEQTQWIAYLNSVDPRQVVRQSATSVPYLRPYPELRGAQRRVEIRSDAFDDLSFSAESTSLREHLGSVGEIAWRIATSLGLSATAVATVAMGARFHDLGKSDARFQRWLDPGGTAEELLAKSGMPIWRAGGAQDASEWPRGARHELLSGRLVAAWTGTQEHDDVDRELLLHLVLSHHGHGRPFVPVVDDKSATPVTALIDGSWVTVTGDLSEADWDQPRRFRVLCERHGVWGLALLEAIVRQSDHAASGAVQVA
jgi:CRISPR-associated endonuclease/helicase Cas3